MDKRIMKTSVTISPDGKQMDTSKLFNDLKEVVDRDSKNGIEIDRKHPAKKLINRFSGGYFSPSYVKAFRTCPASQILSSLLPFVESDATSIGTAVHTILENFYSVKGYSRTMPYLDRLMEDEISKYETPATIKAIRTYIQGFKDTPDYLDPSKPMDHMGLLCYNELFMKGNFKPLGVQLPLPVYSLCDRVDFRGDYAYIIDYKTGMYLNKNITTMDGYLPQLISYKWAVEESYGVEVAGGYLLIPGTKEKIVELNISSLENQSIYIDQLYKYKEDTAKAAESRIYEVKNMNKWLLEKLDKFTKSIYHDNGSREIFIDYDITLKEEV